MQEIPLCFKCEEAIKSNYVFDSLCGHVDCASLVWHAICLMEWREHRAAILNRTPQAAILFFEGRRGGK
jgi:hypothetical protein